MIAIGGENLIDFIQIETQGGNPVYQANPGGGPYNCAKVIGRQKVPVGYLTPISSDSLGDLLSEGLKEAGVAQCGARRPEPSSLAVVSLHDGAATYQFYRQDTAERMVSADGLAASTPGALGALHLGSLAITGGTDAEIWTDYYLSMKQRGVFTSLDPNIRPDFIQDRSAFVARFDRLVRASDLIKLSDEDLQWLFPETDLDTAAKTLLGQSSAGLLVLTCGADGAIAFAGDKRLAVDAVPVRGLVDTVGAGDTFMGTLLTGLYRSGNLTGAAVASLVPETIYGLLQRASAAAALNCEQAGCNPPTLTVLEHRLTELSDPARP